MATSLSRDQVRSTQHDTVAANALRLPAAPARAGAGLHARFRAARVVSFAASCKQRRKGARGAC